MKQFLYGIVFTLVAAAIIFAAAAHLGYIPVNADAKPSRIEGLAAGIARHTYVSANAPKGNNPLPINDDTLLAGMKIYTATCGECHGGLDRKPSAFGEALYPPAPNLINDPVDDDPEGETFFVTKHGIRLTGMPAWTGLMSDDDIWRVTAFLKRMNDLPPAVKTQWKAVSGTDAPSKDEKH